MSLFSILVFLFVDESISHGGRWVFFFCFCLSHEGRGALFSHMGPSVPS